MAGTQSHEIGRKGYGARERWLVVGVLVAVFVGIVATYWIASTSVETGAVAQTGGDPGAVAASPGAENGPATTTVASTDDARAVTVAATDADTGSRVAAPAPSLGEAIHADLYFDFKSARLRADAVRVLQEKAALMDGTSAWAVLLLGYADVHGPAEYNRGLAQRRAEAVKRFLVELGVPETSVKVVPVGQDGSICDDPSPQCQQLNRRVHVEIRKLPGVAAAPVRPVLAEGDVLNTGIPAAPAAADR